MFLTYPVTVDLIIIWCVRIESSIKSGEPWCNPHGSNFAITVWRCAPWCLLDTQLEQNNTWCSANWWAWCRRIRPCFWERKQNRHSHAVIPRESESSVSFLQSATDHRPIDKKADWPYDDSERRPSNNHYASKGISFKSLLLRLSGSMTLMTYWCMSSCMMSKRPFCWVWLLMFCFWVCALAVFFWGGSGVVLRTCLAATLTWNPAHVKVWLRYLPKRALCNGKRPRAFVKTHWSSWCSSSWPSWVYFYIMFCLPLQ